MHAKAISLRQRQAQQLRISVLETVLSELETKAMNDMSMADVAHSAGISLRTLYRHFPDRTALLLRLT